MVGGKVIPAYQKTLPETDRTRINFRFYVVDAPNLRVPWPLPSGIILVPVESMERMQNDSQLAALLADRVACLIEQQPVPLPATNGQIAWNIGLDTGIALVPFAALAYEPYAIHGLVSAIEQAHLNERQRERVGLSLMHDAGFDLLEAPKAEWIMRQKKPRDLADTTPPESALYMYGLLGSTWIPQQ
jgi:hypothetical protein